MDCMKPNIVESCKHINTCYNGKRGHCVGCNIWNILYNYQAFYEWCRERGRYWKSVEQILRKELEEKK